MARSSQELNSCFPGSEGAVLADSLLISDATALSAGERSPDCTLVIHCVCSLSLHCMAAYEDKLSPSASSSDCESLLLTMAPSQDSK